VPKTKHQPVGARNATQEIKDGTKMHITMQGTRATEIVIYYCNAPLLSNIKVVEK
jgi:hypothetical protein